MPPQVLLVSLPRIRVEEVDSDLQPLRLQLSNRPGRDLAEFGYERYRRPVGNDRCVRRYRSFRRRVLRCFPNH